MREALAEARRAAEAGEVPVGAVLLGPDGTLLARAANAPIASGDPTAHAEILAMRQGARLLGNYRLTGCTLVVTLEPCLMCLGAMVHARIAALVYGASDPKSGVVASRFDAASLDFVNHRFPALGGVLAQECGDVLRRFFRARR
jgi:tRNA(adenine34) deaminase